MVAEFVGGRTTQEQRASKEWGPSAVRYSLVGGSARIESEMRQRFDNLHAGQTVVESAAQVPIELVVVRLRSRTVRRTGARLLVSTFRAL